MSAEQVASALNNCNLTNLALQDKNGIANVLWTTSLLLVSTVTWIVSQTMRTPWNKVMCTKIES